MAKTIRDNLFYFQLMALFVVIGGLYLGQTDKSEAIFFFSDNRSVVLNEIFKFVTKLGEGPMFFLLGILALAVNMRYSLLIGITGLATLVLSFGLKAVFAVDRPAAFFAKQNLSNELNFVNGIDLHWGATSFPSGHTMAAFALYGLLAFLLPNKKRISALLFVLALSVGISRIYLVQHFWPDVYAGAILGTLLAMLIYVLQLQFDKSSWLDKPLISLRF